MTLDQLKAVAAEVAKGLRASESVGPDVRKRFLEVRTELIQRGVFDPILMRFDSATVPKASTSQIADRLKTIAESLSI